MKALSVIIITMLLSTVSYGQTYATDATVTDCEGTTVNLFDELDAGKVIVIGWAMPCASCAAPMLAVHNAVLNFAISNPGVVEFWLADDFADTDCSTLMGWASTVGITTAKYFSSSELSMYDYGAAGMPKAVVLGCIDHKVYYNVNNNPTAQGTGNAINTALTDISTLCGGAGISELSNSEIVVSCFPNPTTTVLNVTIETPNTQSIFVEVIGLNGRIYNQTTINNLSASKNEIQIDIENLASGFYFLKVSSDDTIKVDKFQVN